MVGSVRRPATWALIGAILLVGAAAAVDSVRDALRTADSQATPSGSATTTRREPASGLSGVLYYTDDACRLRGLQLPDLEHVGAPKWDRCKFSLSPDGREVDIPATVWHPAAKVRAYGGGIHVEFRNRRPYSLEGSVPTFGRDGRLTFFAGGAIRQLSLRCPLRLDPVRCSSIVVRGEVLLRAARQHPNGDVAPSFLRVSVGEMAWLGSQEGRERLVALLKLHVRTVGTFDLLALFERGRAVGVVSVLQGFSGLRASPGGRYFGVLTGAPPGALLFDREGVSLAPLPLTEVRSFDWSPNERWLAVATPNDVYVVRAESLALDEEPSLRGLGFEAADLAWRGVFISL
jgi:hypothetical protein